MPEPLRILVTGAAGQIAYCLTYMIAHGDVFGKEQEMILHLFDLPECLKALEGFVMELQDCAFPLLCQTVYTSDPKIAFKNISVAFLVGAFPRKEGMKRRDLLEKNIKIFKEQGEFLNKYARKNCKISVIGNPTNTNTLICAQNAPSIPRENFSAMTRLDQNRATAEIAEKLNVNVTGIKNIIVWGNHSNTQYPDVSHAKVTIRGNTRPIEEAINDDSFLRFTFVRNVQRRGSAVIEARKLSSAISAAKAACDHMHDWWFGTRAGQYVTMGVWSDGSYGLPEDVICSLPVEICDKQWTIVHDLPMNDFAKAKLAITGQELLEEKNAALAIFEESTVDTD